MYRAVLVDDEEWIIKGLLRSLETFGEKVCILYAGTSPKKALDVIEQGKPDFVITDIKMPEFNGIELIRKAREKDCDCEFILLTGFADFTFAQQALGLGVVEYLLKPYEVQDLENALEKAKLRLHDKRQYRNYKLVEQLRTRPDAFAQYARRGGLLQNARMVQAVTCALDMVPALNTVLAGGVCLQLTADTGTVFFSTDEDLFYAARLHALRDMNLGISDVFGNTNGLRQQAKQSFIAWSHGLLQGADVYRYQKFPLQTANRIVDRIVLATEKGEWDGDAADFVRAELGKLASFEAMGYTYNRLAVYLNIRTMPDSPEYEMLDIYDFYERFSDVEAFCDFLAEVVAEHGADAVQPPTQAGYDSFAELVRYVNENYGKPLNLKELCASFYINMNYCCALFRRNLNTTFSTYVLELRLKKASWLICTTSLSIQEVAELTGYNDYYYFQRVFKKYYGMTPFKLRNSGDEML